MGKSEYNIREVEKKILKQCYPKINVSIKYQGNISMELFQLLLLMLGRRSLPITLVNNFKKLFEPNIGYDNLMIWLKG